MYVKYITIQKLYKGMRVYSIKAVTSITGITPETLRAWERRYQAVVPVRDLGGRRIYTSADIERLTLLHNARQEGHAISKLASLKNTELQVLLAKSKSSTESDKNLLFVQLVDALMQYRLDRCEELLRHALIAMDPASYAQNFIMPLLKQVGQLWHEGKISIAQEHMFSNCVKRIILSMVHNRMPFSGYRAKLLFTTPIDEQHEFGILLSSWLAVDQGCRCFYLGANLPAEEIISAHQHLKTDIIVLSLVNTPITEKTVVDLQLLIDEIPSNIPIWLGGGGGKYLYETSLPMQRFKLIDDLNGFNDQLKLFNSQSL